jgi:hypothetical protein
MSKNWKNLIDYDDELADDYTGFEKLRKGPRKQDEAAEKNRTNKSDNPKHK